MSPPKRAMVEAMAPAHPRPRLSPRRAKLQRQSIFEARAERLFKRSPSWEEKLEVFFNPGFFGQKEAQSTGFGDQKSQSKADSRPLVNSFEAMYSGRIPAIGEDPFELLNPALTRGKKRGASEALGDPAPVANNTNNANAGSPQPAKRLRSVGSASALRSTSSVASSSFLDFEIPILRRGKKRRTTEALNRPAPVANNDANINANTSDLSPAKRLRSVGSAPSFRSTNSISSSISSYTPKPNPTGREMMKMDGKEGAAKAAARRRRQAKAADKEMEDELVAALKELRVKASVTPSPGLSRQIWDLMEKLRKMQMGDGAM